MTFRLIKAFFDFINRLDFSFRTTRTTLFIFLAAVLLFMDCSGRRNKFLPTYYFPIQTGNKWVFDGGIYKMEITDITKEVGDKIITISYFDSLNVLLWQEKYSLLKDQIYMQSFEPTTKLLPHITFEPPLPFAPLSRKVGFKDTKESIETQTLDTLTTTTQINVDYAIEAIEDIRVPAGLFLDCVKMKINIKYPQTASRPYFIGDQYWWFAPLVGPIKFNLPTASGQLVEMPKIKNRQFETLR